MVRSLALAHGQDVTDTLAAVGHEFAAATAVTRVDEAPDGTVTYATEVHDGWDIGGVANGGYLLALVGRALVEFTGRPPLTVTGHYLKPGLPGPANVTVTPVRLGRRLATVTASLRRGDDELIRVLATCGAASDEPAVLVDGAPPALPPYEACAPTPRGDEPPFPGLNDRLASRLRPGDDGFRTGAVSGRAELAGWFAFADEAPIDEVALLLAADAFAPPIFNLTGAPGWVPTVELTVHVRARPAPGPLRARFHTHFVDGGLLSEDAELWDSTGHLVAQSRQLALTPRP